MNTLIKLAAVTVAALAVPAVSYAQTTNDRPLTRAEVRQQLIDIEQAGYNPATANDIDYPSDVQAAQRRLAQTKMANQNGAGATTSGYGAPANNATQSGE
ncbi:DUF4148 domain-containing protein [Paraburkholderia acidisoli]|uniref:DUF4148 domain-containing protein n=2 Tax=Paraburkholderia acidisoli TaxID=2571748 RepID=A0A7Z2GS12_9BURK|nr:DUF4148 domain-containing protein [Paraburkholderia acidisoli]